VLPSLTYKHPNPAITLIHFCVVFVIVYAMGLSRSSWAWSAFQLDTTLFMYGGVPAACGAPTVTIPSEVNLERLPKQPKRKSEKTEQLKSSRRQTFFRDSLASTSELKSLLADALERGRPPKDYPLLPEEAKETRRQRLRRSLSSTTELRRSIYSFL
jgi:hypothetical protein